ncbi:MAG: hypothetical protein MUP66_03410 [Candidatus Nanohaloarchaeota archaeon QJJ-5]|nr:hypothetical protein [Candidatus Nanohaloarchaeota archaeon QJJ-5]
MTDDAMLGGQELHYKRVLGDVHRALIGGYKTHAGGWAGNTHTLHRLRHAYGEVKDGESAYGSLLDAEMMEQDPVRDIQKALVFGWNEQAETRFGLREDESEDYLVDDEFYEQATDGGDIDAFFEIGEDAGSMYQWYHDTVETLERWGYEEPDAMLYQLADEVRHEPHDRPDLDDEDGLLARLGIR